MATHNPRQKGRKVDHPRRGDIYLANMQPAESGLALRSAVVLNQIRSVDRQRLGKRLGHAGPKTMDRVDKAIQISLGLITL
jgi:mRNA-degrading endonuclease toxin of MazEF toxin-antitoxin module